MGNSLLAVRDINHKYIVVDRMKYGEQKREKWIQNREKRPYKCRM